MPGTKEIKTRIKSIQGMRKVTKAMQMVSAAKMRKAQTAVLNSRTYAELAWELIRNLAPVSMSLRGAPSSEIEERGDEAILPSDNERSPRSSAADSLAMTDTLKLLQSF